ncbi:MAG: hypothetical protein M3Z98_01605 [Candidatus Dormibacteraeota bacterium]|nr:hypothetical protein [Candidatus Dormibacteraeota bacterium]
MQHDPTPRYSDDGRWYWDGQRWIPTTAPAPPRRAGGAATAVIVSIVAALGILFVTSIMVIVILLTMGGQIKNVMSNVTVALNGP